MSASCCNIAPHECMSHTQGLACVRMALEAPSQLRLCCPMTSDCLICGLFGVSVDNKREMPCEEEGLEEEFSKTMQQAPEVRLLTNKLGNDISEL